MAYITSDRISAVAVALLARTIKLPGTVLRIPGGEYSGPSGGTVNLRIPATRTAREQTTPGDTITFDAQSESSVDVVVRHFYDGVRVSDEDLTLSIEDFSAQVLMPQTDAVARRAEDTVAAVMNAVAADDTFDQTDPASVAAQTESKTKVLDAREALTSADVPLDGRYLAVSPSVATRLLHVSELVRVDESGDATALRAAMIGSLFGFQVVETNALAAGSMVAYHRSAFALGTVPPARPAGATSSSTATYQGLSLRTLLQYNPSRLSDESVVSVFAGASLIDVDRAYKVDSGS